jgi:hypothetical protein
MMMYVVNVVRLSLVGRTSVQRAEEVNSKE